MSATTTVSAPAPKLLHASGALILVSPHMLPLTKNGSFGDPTDDVRRMKFGCAASTSGWALNALARVIGFAFPGILTRSARTCWYRLRVWTP